MFAFHLRFASSLWEATRENLGAQWLRNAVVVVWPIFIGFSRFDCRAGVVNCHMRIDNRDDFIDVVAQAVIDRIEERDRVAGLVDAVVRRVLELQKETAEAQAAAEGESKGGKDKEDA
jgi:hypothetical protein